MNESLFDDARRRSIQERFEAYHAEHPEVYELIRLYSAKVREAGFDRFSIDAIFQRIRWYHHIEKRDGDFKLNDHFRSRYARKLMDEDESFADFFEIRALKSA